MEALLGFSVGFCDYVTFLVLFVLVAAGLALAVFVLGLPGRIAIVSNHPEAEAVYLMGWIGFLAVVPWIQALGWAFKPTTVIDVRYSEIEGVNTTVANMEAQLRLARYYLDNTTLTAPEDGHMINLQVRPGMVAGTYRVGGIAAFIADADRYLLATFFQENLKYVKEGQRVEVSLDLYPGQIFGGEVGRVWRGNGIGQYLPSENTSRRPRSIQVYNRRAGFGCDLHERRVRRMGRAAQNVHSRPFLVQLALSDQLLTNFKGYDGLGSKAQEKDSISRWSGTRHVRPRRVRSAEFA